MQKLRIVVLLTVVALLSGCARDAMTLADPRSLMCHADAAAMVADYASLAGDGNAPAAPQFLLLSGGGSHGAWGAGFLSGWRQQGDSPFLVVTGVSTGALQATHAFLGDYDELYELYTTSDDSSIWKSRFFLSLPFANSLRTVKPMRALLKRYIKEADVERVAAQAGKRLLCVGSVELQSGRLTEWNLTEIARRMSAAPEGSEERTYWFDLYHEVIIASAAVPVVFPPVAFQVGSDELVHVDGGVRASLFIAFRNVLAAYDSLRSTALANDAGAPWQNAQVYMIVNGKLAVAPATPRDRIIPVATRALSLVTAQTSFGSVYEVEFMLREREDQTGKADTFASFIPDDQCVAMTALEFDQPGMIALAQAGRKNGSKPVWQRPDPNAVSSGSCD